MIGSRSERKLVVKSRVGVLFPGSCFSALNIMHTNKNVFIVYVKMKDYHYFIMSVSPLVENKRVG